MKSQPKIARPHRGAPIFGRRRRCVSLTTRWHCIARRASQPSQIWGLQMVTLFLAGPLPADDAKSGERPAKPQLVERIGIDDLLEPAEELDCGATPGEYLSLCAGAPPPKQE